MGWEGARQGIKGLKSSFLSSPSFLPSFLHHNPMGNYFILLIWQQRRPWMEETAPATPLRERERGVIEFEIFRAAPLSSRLVRSPFLPSFLCSVVSEGEGREYECAARRWMPGFMCFPPGRENGEDFHSGGGGGLAQLTPFSGLFFVGLERNPQSTSSY